MLTKPTLWEDAHRGASTSFYILNLFYIMIDVLWYFLVMCSRSKSLKACCNQRENMVASPCHLVHKNAKKLGLYLPTIILWSLYSKVTCCHLNTPKFSAFLVHGVCCHLVASWIEYGFCCLLLVSVCEKVGGMTIKHSVQFVLCFDSYIFVWEQVGEYQL